METKNIAIIIKNEDYKIKNSEIKKHWNNKTKNKEIFNKGIFTNLFGKKELIERKINLIKHYNFLKKQKISIEHQIKKQVHLLKSLILSNKNIKADIFIESEISNKKKQKELFKVIKNTRANKIFILSTKYIQNHEDFMIESNSIKKICNLINLKVSIKYLIPYSSKDNYVKAVIDKIMEEIIDIQNIEDYKFVFAINQPAQKVDRNNFIHIDYQIEIIKKAMLVLCNILGFIVEYQVCYYRDNLFNADNFEINVEDAIFKAVKDEKNIVMFPISFVYESPETLVDFDLKYRKYALDLGVNDYILIKPIYDNPYFIKWLFEEVKKFID